MASSIHFEKGGAFYYETPVKMNLNGEWEFELNDDCGERVKYFYMSNSKSKKLEHLDDSFIPVNGCSFEDYLALIETIQELECADIEWVLRKIIPDDRLIRNRFREEFLKSNGVASVDHICRDNKYRSGFVEKIFPANFYRVSVQTRFSSWGFRCKVRGKTVRILEIVAID